ncbi:efflux RND transporter periplasmic adaptor subunit [Sulfitobacter dubius]|uniref:efflux RND transporter periplasmic adaptor subunit n=1 Tax=Sulfitobacter dubius TaxID=218673 RepID=UPI002941E927|nr:efflux RND transporter periplasmic adaptor subunit [Sulfitobacter dubius]WOI30764.1 efflux RND transporter periplasmic adaptor subunit [Sulfitobacter dubius]
MYKFLILTSAALAALVSLATTVAAQMPPKHVGVIEAIVQDVPRIVTLPGRAVAASSTAIRPRVSGIVIEILYDPGRPIEAGAPMFRIDDTTYQANVAAASAQVASAEAQVTEAQAAFTRTDRLVGSGSTVAQVESARAALDQARAALDSAKANLTLAEAQLNWTTVTSPLSGVASVSEASIGDLVTEGQIDAMATVTQLDPIEIDMYEPSSRFLSVMDDITDGTLRLNEQVNATLTLENGRTYQSKGALVAPGVTVSSSTGSIDTRFRFDNPDNMILPGMFMRGQINLGITQAILVSQSATSRDKLGKLSAWVVVEGKVSQRDLVEDGTYQQQWIVTDGLEGGEMIVVDGLAGLTEGAEVVSVPVSFDENGVVRDVVPAAAVPDTGTSADMPTAAPSDAPATE